MQVADMAAVGLDEEVRAMYRDTFRASVARGEKMPLVVPYSLLGAFIIPIAWLTIPQARYPWVYSTRWLIALFVIVFNVHVTQRTSSDNIAMAYLTGLLAAWGIIYNLNIIIWTRPQLTAARIIRRKTTDLATENGSIVSKHPDPNMYNKESIVRRRPANGTRSRESMSPPDGEALAHIATKRKDDFEYVWQPFPVDGRFSERLNWVFDLATSFRGCGWNWAISSIPRPKTPADVSQPTLVDMSSMPTRSEAGFTRCLTRRQFLTERLSTIAIMYMVIDIAQTTMAKDPYFVLGPDFQQEVPPHLASLPSILRLWARQSLALAGFLSGITGMMASGATIQYFLMPRILPMRDELWHYPSIYGSFSNVLDRGLSGWWGSWWHQTFRAQFIAPATYLLRNDYISKGTLASTCLALCVSFGQSGALHAFGSITSVPETRPWRPLAFFLLQAVGIVIQHALSQALRRLVPLPPKWLTRSANLVSTVLWVQWTSRFFCDDIASTGLWLCDPLPFSPLRMLGFGAPGDRWWRWNRHQFPSWHTGQRWWESGIAL